MLTEAGQGQHQSDGTDGTGVRSKKQDEHNRTDTCIVRLLSLRQKVESPCLSGAFLRLIGTDSNRLDWRLSSF